MGTEEYWILIGMTAGSSRREAVDCYGRAIERNPNHAWAYFMRALSRMELDDWEGAFEDLNEAIRVNPRFDYAYGNRGWLQHYLKQNVAAAINDATEAMRLNPNEPDYPYNRGNAKKALADIFWALLNSAEFRLNH